MMDLYIGHDSEPAASSADADAVEDSLLNVQSIIENHFHENDNAYYEALAWLRCRLAQFRNVTADTRRKCLRALLPQKPNTTQLSSQLLEAKLQLYQLLCECWPTEVAELFQDLPQVIRSFFAGSDDRIVHWFQHFSMDGLRKFQFGAYALATYALEHRDTAWHHLVWLGSHGQAPVSVAAKPFYFCKLDIVPTVRNLLAACPDFWTSEHFLRCLRSGEFLAVGLPYFCDALQQLVADWEAGREEGGRQEGRRAARLVSRFVDEVEVQVLFSRLLQLLPSEQVLAVVRALGEDPLVQQELAAAPRSTAALQDLSFLVFKQASWDSLALCVLCHAVACQRGPLIKLLEDDEDTEGSGLLRELQAAARKLHGAGGGGHRRLLLRLRGRRGSRERLLAALEVWTLRLALLQLVEADAGQLPIVASRHGFKLLGGQAASHAAGDPSAGKLAAAGTGTAYALLSSDSEDDDTHRRGHKRKRKKKSKKKSKDKKRRRSAEQAGSPWQTADLEHDRSSSQHAVLDFREGGAQAGGPGGAEGGDRAGVADGDEPDDGAGRSRGSRSSSSEQERSRGTGQMVARAPAVPESQNDMSERDAAGGGPCVGSWRVNMAGFEVVGSTADVVDLMCCFACSTWLDRL